MVAIGEKVPDFSLPINGGDTLSLSDLAGKKAVIYFYPKDNTSGCTREAEAFRHHYESFQKYNTAIVGVSRDSVRSHDNFIKKYDLPFPLISDADETLCNIFGVIQEKSMYGRTYMGIVRSTFLIDEDGKLIVEWRKVKVKGHAEAVLDTVIKLS